MGSWKWFLLSFFGGGISFWISDLIISALDHNEQGYVVTAVCPVVLIVFYAIVLRLRKAERSGPSTAIFAICGMWVLALSFVLLAQRIRGGKGTGFGWGDFGYLLVSSFLPTRIAFFVGLDGSVIALLIGTFAMLVCHFYFESTRWIVPPSLRAASHHAKK
jgi:hypothetical protein